MQVDATAKVEGIDERDESCVPVYDGEVDSGETMLGGRGWGDGGLLRYEGSNVSAGKVHGIGEDVRRRWREEANMR